MSVSVDPVLGVHLHDLWCDLEAREETAWRRLDVERTRDRPRALQVYRDFPGCAEPSNQPWYDGGDLTLVAAPKALSPEGPLGCRLGWRDVLDSLWSCYRPDVGGAVKPRGGDSEGRLFDTAAAVAAKHPLAPTGLRFVDLVCAGPDCEPPDWTTTLECALAGCLSGAVPAIDRLPDPADFDVFRQRGGVVMVSGAGVVLLEEREGLGFPATALRGAAHAHAETLAKAVALESDLADATDRALLAVEHADERHMRSALGLIYRMQMSARALIGARVEQGPGADVPEDPLVARVSDSIGRRWEADARFEAVIARADELAEMVKSATEIRSAALLRTLSIYGFPAIVFGALVGNIFLPLSDDRGKDFTRWHVAFGALGAYAVLIAASMALSHWLVRRTDAAWKRALKPDGRLGD